MASRRPRIVAINGLLLRALIINDRRTYADELEALTIIFRGRRFRLLVTRGILDEYRTESQMLPQFQIQPTLDNLVSRSRAIYFEEDQLSPTSIDPRDLPASHRVVVRDAISADARYVVTTRRKWLDMSDRIESGFGLRIVSPRRFVELKR